jgi:hypothetical protein
MVQLYKRIRVFNQGGIPRAIALGPAPWNHIRSIKFQDMGKRPSLSDASIFKRYRAIPLGPTIPT